MIEDTQPLLEKINALVSERIGTDNVESYLNELSKNVPTFVVSSDKYLEMMKILKEEFSFNYLLGLHGTDFQEHFEMNVQLRALNNGDFIIVKTKVDREVAEVDSIANLWPGASYQESEVYDLLGVKFIGNEDLYRIFLGDDWVGYPLRKDYVQYEDQEVQ